MKLRFPAEDMLTGASLEIGTEVIGEKTGGAWEFTAEPIGPCEFKRLREAMLRSLGDAKGAPVELSDEDYRVLQEYGSKYPYVRAMVGCAVPGLD